MNGIRHFIIFQRTEGHCATWLVRARSLEMALATYYVQGTVGAEILENGCIRSPGCGTVPIVYSHPLECIESELKSYDGLYGRSWEIRELLELHWDTDFAEIFCSADPEEVAGHISLCRPMFHSAFPQSRARAFVWYLKSGPLVTFHKRKSKRCRHPIEVLARYHVPWKSWPQVNEWRGSYDILLTELETDYPLPEVFGPPHDEP